MRLNNITNIVVSDTITIDWQESLPRRQQTKGDNGSAVRPRSTPARLSRM
jgi:hypothetical protein